MAQPLSAENKVVVGIDFGTTFSGVAWAKIGDDHPNLVQLWPGDNAPSSEKVPTQILYDKSPAGIKWGYQIPSMAKRYQSFKLALETTQPVQSSVISQCYSDPKARTSDKSHTAEQLTEDYLKALKSHLVSTLGHELGNLQAQNTPLEFLITVPAVWSDLAKEKTLTAAEKAGLADHAPIHMISEPEAAAIYVLQRKKLHNLLVGDTFVICDAGGGTVDLISYTVVKLHPIVEVKEAAPGSGGRCGSTFINGRFKDYLQFKLRHETGWDDEVLQEAMNDFELRVKRNYYFLAPEEIYTVSVPGLCQNSTLGVNKRGKLILKSKEVREILEPVIAEVVKLVLEQIKATKTKVKSILLVGGFGGSKYFHEQIRAAVNKDIEVIKPPYAWSAVVQGALIKNLSHYDPQYATVHLSSRAARKHLGTLISMPYDKDIHLDSQKYFDPCDGIFKIRCMEWFIKKGHAVTEDTPFNFHYYRRWLRSEGQRQEFTTAIYCDRTSLAPGLYRDYKVKELIQLKTDISTVPQDSLLKILGKDGKRYYGFNFSIQVVYESAHTKYTSIHDGKRYGTVTAEYA